MKKKTHPTPNAILTDEQFWALLEGLNPEDRGEDLKARLLKLPPEILVDFDAAFIAATNRLNSYNLYAGVHLICGGYCSDDRFQYSQYGIVARGKAIFEATVANPEAIADWLKPGDWIDDEPVGYAAMHAYEELTGEEDMPVKPSGGGGGWFGDENLVKTDRRWKRAFPKLYAMFRGPKPAAKVSKTPVKVLEGKSAGGKKAGGKAKAKAK